MEWLKAQEADINGLNPSWHFCWVHHHNFGHFI